MMQAVGGNKPLTAGSAFNLALKGLLSAAPSFCLCSSLLLPVLELQQSKPSALWTVGRPPPPSSLRPALLCPGQTLWTRPLPPPRCRTALTSLPWGCGHKSGAGGGVSERGYPVSHSPFQLPGAALGQGLDRIHLPISRTSIYLPQSHFPQESITKASDGVKRGNFNPGYSWLTFNGCTNKVCFVGNKPFR